MSSKGNYPLLAFNRGLVSSSALARVDVERIKLSAEVMTNWLPKTQGSMKFRPGLQFLGSSKDDAAARWIEFVASTTNTALLEITDEALRVWIDDEVMTRPSVATTISNGSFASDTGWTSTLTGDATSTFGGSGLILNAETRGGLAKVTREITVLAGDQGEEHALRIVVDRGPVVFRCGSADGTDNYISEASLGPGVHSLAFTPISNFHLTFQTSLDRDIIVESISVEGSGEVELTAPWLAADLDKIRTDQSADVVYVACEGYQPRKIERRGTGRSWSIVKSQPEDGPFSATRTSSSVKLKPGATFGNTTLTADRAFFKSSHVGATFRLFHKGYNGSFKLGGEDQYTDPWRVTGVNNPDSTDLSGAGYSDRDWSAVIAGTWSGTLRVQRSFEVDGEDGGYVDFREGTSVTTTDITANATITNTDEDDNSAVFYRIGFKPGEYTSGTAEIAVSYDGGGDYGICRVTGFTSETQVDIEILRPFTGTDYTDNWREGEWSDLRGWPTEVKFYEGRLWWSGRKIWGSVSDSFESFSDDIEGDSGPINRSLTGPVDTVNFMLPLQRLILGTAGSEISIRSSSFDEPLTPANTMAKDASTQGSATTRAAKVDSRGIFVQRSKKRVFELIYDSEAYDYRPSELTLLCPDIADGTSFAGLAVQRQPDTRIHFWFADGRVAVLTYEPREELNCWSIVDTSGADGEVEAVMVLPGDDEDRVYYHVKRTIDGQTKRYLEKWALDSECVGGTLNKQADSFITYSGSATNTLTGLDHLEGEDVVVWADGNALEDDDGDIETFTVSSGSITLPASYSNMVAGLPYTAPWRSTKLAYGGLLGTSLTQKKRINYLGVILANAHHKGLQFGPDFDTMDDLPQVYQGAVVESGTVYTSYDAPAFEFPGLWNTDARLCLRANAPRPCEVLAAVVGMNTEDKA